MSIFAAFRAFAFFRNHIFYRERTRKMRNTRKTYVHFRNLSRFRIFSQFYILSRKDAENICPFSQSFALSLFSAILYFIAKERGKCGIRGKHMSIFATFRAFAFFRNHIFIAKGRGKRGIRGNLGIYFGATIEHYLSICASFALLT